MALMIAATLLLLSALQIGATADATADVQGAPTTTKQRQILQVDIFGIPDVEDSELDDVVGVAPIVEDLEKSGPEAEPGVDLDTILDDAIAEPTTETSTPEAESIEDFDAATPAPDADGDMDFLDVASEEPLTETTTPAAESSEDIDDVLEPESDADPGLLDAVSGEAPSVEASPESEAVQEDIDPAPEPEFDADPGLVDVVSGEVPGVESSPEFDVVEEDIDAGAPQPDDEALEDLVLEPSVETKASPVDGGLDVIDPVQEPEVEVQPEFLDEIPSEAPGGEGAPLDEPSKGTPVASDAPPEPDSDVDFDERSVEIAPAIDVSPEGEQPAPAEAPTAEAIASGDEHETTDFAPVEEQSAEAPSGEGATTNTVIAEMTFPDLDFEELNSGGGLQSFTDSIASSIAAASGVPLENVSVVNVRSGSVIVDAEITVPEGGASLDVLSSALQDPAIFDEDFTQQFGTPRVSVVAKAPPAAVPSQEPAAGVGAVVPTVEAPESEAQEGQDDGDGDDGGDDDDIGLAPGENAQGAPKITTVFLAIETAVVMPSLLGIC